MNRRAAGKRRQYPRGCQEAAKVIPHRANPRILCGRKGRKRTRKRIAHGQASAPTSDLARLRDETGSERVLKSRAPQFGCPQRCAWRTFENRGLTRRAQRTQRTQRAGCPHKLFCANCGTRSWCRFNYLGQMTVQGSLARIEKIFSQGLARTSWNGANRGGR